VSWRRLVRAFGHHGQATAPDLWLTDRGATRAPFTVLQATQPGGARLHLVLAIARDRVELDALRFNLEDVTLEAPEADGLRHCRRGRYADVVAAGWHVAGDPRPGWRPRVAVSFPPAIAERPVLPGVDDWLCCSLLYLELDWCRAGFTVGDGLWASVPLIEAQVMAEQAGRSL